MLLLVFSYRYRVFGSSHINVHKKKEKNVCRNEATVGAIQRGLGSTHDRAETKTRLRYGGRVPGDTRAGRTRQEAAERDGDAEDTD